MAVEKAEGIPYNQAVKKIFLKDSKGLIVKNRSSGGISHHKEPFAQDHPEMDDLVIVRKPQIKLVLTVPFSFDRVKL